MWHNPSCTLFSLLICECRIDLAYSPRMTFEGVVPLNRSCLKGLVGFGPNQFFYTMDRPVLYTNKTGSLGIICKLRVIKAAFIPKHL